MEQSIFQSRQPLVSVVVPIYNVEKYIERCINSILSQSYKNIQLILVDDGSTDNSGKIIEKYNNRAIIIHQHNLGQSAARNTGVSYATGKYLMYVDSDDYISQGTILTLVKKMETSSYDMCCFRGYSKDNRGQLYNIGRDFSVSEFDKNSDIVKDGLLGKNIKTSVCSKIFLLSMIRDNNITFLEGVINEDYLYTNIVILYAQRVAFVNQPFYYVERRQNSTSRNFKDENITTIVHHYHYLLKVYSEHGKLDQFKEFLYCQYLIGNLFTLYTIAYNVKKYIDFLYFHNLVDKKDFYNRTAKSALLLKGKIYPIIYSLCKFPKLFYITVKVAKIFGLKSYV